MACVAGLKIGEGVVEEDLGDVLYPVSIDLLTVDTGMDEGNALRERVYAWGGRALGGTTNASAGTLQADGGGVVVNEEDEKGRRKPVS